MDIEHGRKQIVGDLVVALLARSADLGDLFVSLAVGLVLGGLVPLCVLSRVSIALLVVGHGEQYLGLKLLILGLLARAVGLNLLLGLISCLSHPLCAVWGAVGCQSSVCVASGEVQTYTRELCPQLSAPTRASRMRETYPSAQSWMLPSRPGWSRSAIVICSHLLPPTRSRISRAGKGSYIEEGLDARGVLGRLPSC